MQHQRSMRDDYMWMTTFQKGHLMNRRNLFWLILAFCAVAVVTGLTINVSQAAAPVQQTGPGNDRAAQPVTSNSGSGAKQAPLPPARPDVVLYDQINNPAPVPG